MNTVKAREKEIIRRAQEQMPWVRMEPVTVRKNNGQKHEGICVSEPGKNISVVIYWSSIWADCGKSDTDEETVTCLCRMAQEELAVQIKYESLSDWQEAKHMVHKKVVNYARNTKRLRGKAYRKYLDLVEIYCLKISVPGRGDGLAEISRKQLKGWGVSIKELEKQAAAHMDFEDYEILPMEELLAGFGFEVERPDPMMYVLCRKDKDYAADAMTSPAFMKQFAARAGGDCYILPASVFELIAVPCRKGVDAVQLQKMVQEVNRDAVAPEDFLSDSVYYCHADSGEVELCCV